MHEVLVNRLGGLSLPRSGVRLTDRPDMTLDVYRGRKTTIQQQNPLFASGTDDRFCKSQFLYTWRTKIKLLSYTLKDLSMKYLDSITWKL